MVDELLEAQRLATRLRRVRLERGLSLRGAAAGIGVTKETLSDLERARRHPHPPTLAKIAEGYGVEISDLLGPMVEEEPALAGDAGKAEASEDMGQPGVREQGESNPAGLVKAVARSAEIWTRTVADPRLNQEQRATFVAAARVLEDQISISLGSDASSSQDVGTALIRVSRVDEQYQDLAEMTARLDAITKDHEKAVVNELNDRRKAG